MIPCSNPRAQYLSHREAIDRAVLRVLDAGRYVHGPECSAFEQEFAVHAGARFGIGVANGTDAIEISLRALGIGAGDEVVTTSHTAVATVAGITRTGATPVLADIDPTYFTLAPDAVERALSPRTRAVVAVHLYGQPAELEALSSIAERRGIALIEDSAQAHGAEYAQHRVGSIGRFGCFSFYPTKNLGAIGDGGMIVTSDEGLAQKCRELREYGWDAQRVCRSAGVNSRLDELQAAILRVKLATLDADNARRAAIAALYDARLQATTLTLPRVRPNTRHAYHLYVVRTARRDELLAHLARAGVAAGVHYAVPVHLQPGFAERVKVSGTLSETERAAQTVLSLPMYPELSHDDAAAVVAALQSWEQKP
jgi:dTDP-4-amino-4,6-dideoxygalactose transaminase